MSLFEAADALWIFLPPSSNELSCSSLKANLENPNKSIIISKLLFISYLNLKNHRNTIVLNVLLVIVSKILNVSMLKLMYFHWIIEILDFLLFFFEFLQFLVNDCQTHLDSSFWLFYYNSALYRFCRFQTHNYLSPQLPHWASN